MTGEPSGLSGAPSAYRGRLAATDLRLEIVLGGDDAASAGRCATRTFRASPGCVLKPKVLKCG